MLIQQTSRDAYESVNRGNIPIRTQILDLFDLVRFNKSVPNWTCDELECVLDGKHQTVSASIRSLVKEGLVRNSGLKRKTRSGRSAICWELEPFPSRDHLL